MTCSNFGPEDARQTFLRAYGALWFPVIGGWLPAAGAKRRRLKDRLALGLPAPVHKSGAVWIHALSVGEVLSALPLIHALKNLSETPPLIRLS